MGPRAVACTVTLLSWVAAQSPPPPARPDAPAQRDASAQRDAPAGARARATAASTTLHAAWLSEVLDLDVDAAARRYQAVVERSAASQPEHWLAVTRLAELRHHGHRTLPAPDTGAAPPPVRDALRRLAEQPVLRDLDGLRTPEPDLPTVPDPHEATATVHEWVRTQLGLTADDRLRQRMRNRRGSQPRTQERWYAADILRVELQNRPQQAQALRTWYFADWRPPTWTGEPAACLAAARAELDRWIAEEEAAQSWHARLLIGLRDALLPQENEPEKALALVARMPIYAERLLGGAK